MHHCGYKNLNEIHQLQSILSTAKVLVLAQATILSFPSTFVYVYSTFP